MASIAVTVTVSQRQIDQLQRELVGIANGVPRAITGSINKVLGKARTEVVAGLMETLAIKKKDVLRTPSGTERITVVKASKDRLEGLVRVMGRPIGLVNFQHKDLRKRRKNRRYGQSFPGEGVRVQIYRNQPPTLLRHVFKTTGRGGNVHLFQRTMRGGKPSPRLPIERLTGPSLLTVVRKNPQISTRVQDRIDSELQKELDSQVNRLLKRRKG